MNGIMKIKPLKNFDMTNEEINFTEMILLCTICTIPFVVSVGVDLITYFTRHKCKNCKHCKNGVLCDIGNESVENLNINGQCGFYKKK